MSTGWEEVEMTQTHQLDQHWAHSDTGSFITLSLYHSYLLSSFFSCRPLPHVLEAEATARQKWKEKMDATQVGAGWKQFSSFEIRVIFKEDLITWHHTTHKMNSWFSSPLPTAFLRTKDLKTICNIWHGVSKEQVSGKLGSESYSVSKFLGTPEQVPQHLWFLACLSTKWGNSIHKTSNVPFCSKMLWFLCRWRDSVWLRLRIIWLILVNMLFNVAL